MGARVEAVVAAAAAGAAARAEREAQKLYGRTFRSTVGRSSTVARSTTGSEGACEEASGPESSQEAAPDARALARRQPPRKPLPQDHRGLVSSVYLGAALDSRLLLSMRLDPETPLLLLPGVPQLGSVSAHSWQYYRFELRGAQQRAVLRRSGGR